MLQTLSQTVTSPLFWQGFALCGLLAIALGVALVVVIGRMNDDVDPHAANLGTGAAWPDSARRGSDQTHPRSRRSELRSGPR